MKFVRLGGYATKIGSGQTPSGGYRAYSTSGIPLIRSQNVLMGSFTTDGLALISKQIDEEMSGSRVVKGDVLLNITGASIGRVCVVPDEICPANVNQHVCIIRCSDGLLPAYLAAALASPEFQSLIWQDQAGATRQALTKDMIEGFQIPWRPIDDQRQIAARLKAQLAEVEIARQAAQEQVCEAGFLQRRLLETAFDHLKCEPTKLGQVITNIQTGKSFQTAETLARFDELGVLKVSAVSWAQFRADQAKALTGEYMPAEHHRVKQDDLLISRANTRELVGAIVLVERDYPMRLLSDKTLRLLVDENRADKSFLLFALRTELARKHIELYATGTSDSMRNISQDVINSIPICLPSLDEQRRIVSHLKKQFAEVDAIAQAAAVQLAEIERLPQKLLAQAFATLPGESQ